MFTSGRVVGIDMKGKKRPTERLPGRFLRFMPSDDETKGFGMSDEVVDSKDIERQTYHGDEDSEFHWYTSVSCDKRELFAFIVIPRFCLLDMKRVENISNFLKITYISPASLDFEIGLWNIIGGNCIVVYNRLHQ